MAVALEVANDRHPRFLLDTRHQALAPRGTITSMKSVISANMNPTAARSVVGTS